MADLTWESVVNRCEMWIRHIEHDMVAQFDDKPSEALKTLRGLKAAIPLLRAEPELESFPPMMSHFSLRWLPSNGLEVGLFYLSEIEKYKVSLVRDLSSSLITLESTNVGLDELVDTIWEFFEEARRSFDIRPLEAADSQEVDHLVAGAWGTDYVVSRGKIYYPRELPGWVAMRNNRWVGFLTYHIADGQCEIVSLDAMLLFRGVGSALIAAVCESAKQADCRRIWLITTNDNLNALRFYQKRGFTLAALYPNALENSRKLKPQIPMIGMDGIPLRDEIELERWF